MAKAKKKKAKPVKLEKHIAQVEKRLEKLRKLITDNQAREAAMVEELAELVGQLPPIVAAVVEPPVT
jgi:hypothetical protein